MGSHRGSDLATYRLVDKTKYEKKRCGTKEYFEMEDKGKSTNNRNKHAVILTVIGIILLILGIAIVSIHGAPLRGSGVGTATIVLGVVLLVIAFLRYFYKRAQ